MAECGCRVVAERRVDPRKNLTITTSTTIAYCPMHKAAPAMLAALEGVAAVGKEADAAHGGYLPMLHRMAVIANEAIAQARPQEHE